MYYWYARKLFTFESIVYKYWGPLWVTTGKTKNPRIEDLKNPRIEDHDRTKDQGFEPKCENRAAKKEELGKWGWLIINGVVF